MPLRIRQNQYWALEKLTQVVVSFTLSPDGLVGTLKQVALVLGAVLACLVSRKMSLGVYEAGEDACAPSMVVDVSAC